MINKFFSKKIYTYHLLKNLLTNPKKALKYIKKIHRRKKHERI